MGDAGSVRARIGVVRLLAVRAPVALVRAGVGVEHDDAAVAVAVGDVHLVGGEIDFRFGRAIEVRRVGVALALAFATDLQQELSLPRELQHLVALVGRQPHVVFAVDGDAVHRRRPLVACARPAPRRDEVAGHVELENRRRDGAADRRDRALVAGLQRGRAARLLHAVGAGHHAGFLRRDVAAMGNPDVIARVDAEADDRSEHPVVRQRLRPHRIDLIHRRLHGRARLRRADRLQRPLRDGEHRDDGENRDAGSVLTCSSCCSSFDDRHGAHRRG